MSEHNEIEVISANEVEVVQTRGQYIRDLMYDKNNVFINAAFDLSKEEDQLFNLCISDMSRAYHEDGTIRSKIPISEVRAFFNGNDGSFYHWLKTKCGNINKCQLGLEINGKFAFYQVIQTVMYEKEGKNSFLYVTYNTDLVKMGLIENLKGSWTKLSLRTIKSFTKNYSLRLYELLRKEAYNRKGEHRSSWDIEIDRYDLLFKLGVIDSNEKGIKEALSGYTEHPNYEKVVALKIEMDRKAKSKRTGIPVEEVELTNNITDWYCFRTRVLEPAIKEINEKTELVIPEYKTIKGKSVKTIIFVGVRYKTQEELDKTHSELAAETNMTNNDLMEESEKFAFCSSIASLLESISTEIKFTSRQIMDIAEASQYNETLIKEMFKLLLKQKNIRDATGWMVQAVREHYNKPQEYKGNEKKKEKKPLKKEGGFNDFQQREYDYTELEKLLLRGQTKKENIV